MDREVVPSALGLMSSYALQRKDNFAVLGILQTQEAAHISMVVADMLYDLMFCVI
jgi:hypothetical protein